jgi:hypothetical protein
MPSYVLEKTNAFGSFPCGNFIAIIFIHYVNFVLFSLAL